MLSTSALLPLELLHAAETLYRANKQNNPQLSVTKTSITGDVVTSHTGIKLGADCAIEDCGHADVIFLPALWRNPRPIIAKNQKVIPWLIEQYENGAVIAGVGTGCCFLAEAGLLNGKPATTHWYFFDHFQKWYPDVDLKRQYFITKAGNLYCTGSVNSLADLTVNFIQRYYSQDIAAHVERHFFHEIRRAYEQDTSLLDPSERHHDETIVQTQIWMQNNLDKEITFAQLADLFRMSLRSFNRRFKQATGITPLAYLQKVRMQTAKDLLQTSNLSITEIGYKVGFQDAAYFSNLFKKVHGVTPSEYRTTVRKKLFSV